MRKCRYCVLLVAGIAASGCGGATSDAGTGPDATASTFALIQTSVLADNCTSCHTSGVSGATESGLALDAATAYRNLVKHRQGEVSRRSSADIVR